MTSIFVIAGVSAFAGFVSGVVAEKIFGAKVSADVVAVKADVKSAETKVAAVDAAVKKL
jgi:hypothetical protein